MSAKDEERILALPRAALFGADGLFDAETWRGVRRVDPAPLLALAARVGSFRRRGDIEADPAWQQLIPYLLLRDGERLFLMRRTRAGGDARLHDRWTIGIGGHLNASDADVPGGLRREWREEIAADFEPVFTPLGLLNDDEDPVGRVHLGVVYVADAAGRPVNIREHDALTGRFASLDEVRAVRGGLETWSQLLLASLEA